MVVAQQGDYGRRAHGAPIFGEIIAVIVPIGDPELLQTAVDIRGDPLRYLSDIRLMDGPLEGRDAKVLVPLISTGDLGKFRSKSRGKTFTVGLARRRKLSPIPLHE